MKSLMVLLLIGVLALSVASIGCNQNAKPKEEAAAPQESQGQQVANTEATLPTEQMTLTIEGMT